MTVQVSKKTRFTPISGTLRSIRDERTGVVLGYSQKVKRHEYDPTPFLKMYPTLAIPMIGLNPAGLFLLWVLMDKMGKAKNELFINLSYDQLPEDRVSVRMYQRGMLSMEACQVITRLNAKSGWVRVNHKMLWNGDPRKAKVSVRDVLKASP